MNSIQNRSAIALVPASFQEDEEEEEPSEHIPFDIHNYFGLAPESPICLDSLEDPPPGQKPAYTYATLVKLAIYSSPQRRLTLSRIYNALEQRFSWFRECKNPNAWKVRGNDSCMRERPALIVQSQTSIRHSLSLLSVFVKLPLDVHMPGKGSFWTVDFTKGDGYKRPRKRGPSKKTDSAAQVLGANLGSVPDKSWNIQPQTSLVQRGPGWQESEDEINIASGTSQNGVEMAEPASDPQFRHYRTSTFLYPEVQNKGSYVGFSVDVAEGTQARSRKARAKQRAGLRSNRLTLSRDEAKPRQLRVLKRDEVHTLSAPSDSLQFIQSSFTSTSTSSSQSFQELDSNQVYPDWNPVLELSSATQEPVIDPSLLS